MSQRIRLYLFLGTFKNSCMFGIYYKQGQISLHLGLGKMFPARNELSDIFYKLSSEESRGWRQAPMRIFGLRQVKAGTQEEIQAEPHVPIIHVALCHEITANLMFLFSRQLAPSPHRCSSHFTVNNINIDRVHLYKDTAPGHCVQNLPTYKTHGLENGI